MTLVNQRFNICRYTVVLSFIVGYILGSVSLSTLTAVSVDRLLAMLLGLRYRRVVTLKPTYVTVIDFWAFSIVGTTVYFLNYLITIRCNYIVIAVCLVTLIVSYSKIFVTLHHHQTRVQSIAQKEQSNNSTEYTAIQKGIVQCNAVTVDTSF